METIDPDLKPVGYGALIERHRLNVIAPYLQCFIAPQGGKAVERTPDREIRVYPATYWPGEELHRQLRFALRYEGVQLAVLEALFQTVGPSALEAWIQSEPTGSYARRAWFLYEWLTGDILELPDLARGSYVDAVDPATHFTAEPKTSRRHMVRDNLPGVRGFCPLIRRTKSLEDFVSSVRSHRTFDPSWRP